MKELQETINAENISEASDNKIPEDTYNAAIDLLIENYTILHNTAATTSKPAILNAIKLAYVGGEVPAENRTKILEMSQALQKIVEAVVVCKGYEMQNESAELKEGENV